MNAGRRNLLVALGAAAAGSFVGRGRLSAAPLYPPTDLAPFAIPIRARAGDLHFGYAAITWGGDDARAIDEISQVGFRGIQVRGSAVDTYSAKPAVLRDLLAAHKLEFVALSSGYAGKASTPEADDVTLHTRNARFARDAGCKYVQIIDAARPEGRVPVADDFRALARRLTEIGKRTADLGVPLGYHHHMGSLGQGPEEVARVMDAVDRRYVKLILDVAHYTQGGGDPARAVRDYHDAILFLHIKDVRSDGPGSDHPFQFVELGRGRVDLPGIFAALDAVKFRGWGIVELDAVPDPGGTPKASAEANRRYVEERLKLKV